MTSKCEKIISALERAKRESEEYALDRVIVPFRELNIILELLKKQKPKSFDLVEQTLFAKTGLCPECGEKLHSGMHPNYCGFCGQAVKWE